MADAAPILDEASQEQQYIDDIEILSEVYCDELTLRRKIGVLYGREKPLTPAAVRLIDALIATRTNDIS